MRSKILRSIGVVAALGVVAAISAPLGTQAAATTTRLTITGLSGGTDTKTLSASWFNYSLEGIPDGGGGGGAGTPSVGPLVVRHALKPAQSLILEATALGRTLPRVRLVVKQGDKTITTITVEDARITEAVLRGKAAVPQTTFSYTKVIVNTKGARFCWDATLNTSC